MRNSLIIAGIYALLAAPLAADNSQPFLSHLNNNQSIASTVPSNGDENPYGVAIVQRTVGSLVANSVLVSNFNNSQNLQGTGTTIMQVGPNNKPTVFAQITAAMVPKCPGGVGLTTALVALRSGWVIVGSLPTANGMAATSQAGCLIVLNSLGQVVETFQGAGINGPWDMTAVDFNGAVELFVTNVLNGTVAGNGTKVNQGSVLRMVLAVSDDQGDDNNQGDDNGQGDDNSQGNGNSQGKGHAHHGDSTSSSTAPPRELSRMVIASGFGERTDPSALVIGPTGLALGADGTLYVADTLANRIAAIPDALARVLDAGTGTTVSQGSALNAPLGLAIAPNGDILTVNGGDGNIVETTPAGSQVVVKNIDTTGPDAGGTLFGLAISPVGNGVYFVNDGNNTLNLLH